MSASDPPWRHAPLHRLAEQGTYFVTLGTYLRQHHFRGRERLAVLPTGLLKVCHEFSWNLEAWAVFSNHYHFVAHSPVGHHRAEGLRDILGKLHGETAKWINRLDDAETRKVWHNYRETRLTYENSYFAAFSSGSGTWPGRVT